METLDIFSVVGFLRLFTRQNYSRLLLLHRLYADSAVFLFLVWVSSLAHEIFSLVFKFIQQNFEIVFLTVVCLANQRKQFLEEENGGARFLRYTWELFTKDEGS